MSVAGVHGHLLEITVVGCTRLRDTEWFSRQDPYVTIEYASTKFRTRTCTDGGKNPMFQEKFTISMIEGLREIVVSAWNSNTVNHDDFIGNGKIPLLKVLSEGYDDSNWPIQTKSGRHAGEVHVIMHYANAKKYGHQASAPYMAPHQGHYPQPHAAMPANPGYPPMAAYPQAPHPSHAPYPAAYGSAPYPPPPAVHTPYPPAVHTSHSPYPPQPSVYPPQGYPPAAHGSVYPPVADPSRSVYPPPPAPYQGTYPPPPY